MDLQLQDIFTLLDSDGSDTITIDEVRVFVEGIGNALMTDGDLELLFKEADADESGKIEADEFVKLIRAVTDKVEMTLEASVALFKRYCYRRLFTSVVQEDGDGLLLSDLRKLLASLEPRLDLKYTDEDVRKLFEKFDSDDSEHIDAKEFEAILNELFMPELMISRVVHEFEMARAEALERHSTMRSLFQLRRKSGDDCSMPRSPRKSIASGDISDDPDSPKAFSDGGVIEDAGHSPEDEGEDDAGEGPTGHEDRVTDEGVPSLASKADTPAQPSLANPSSHASRPSVTDGASAGAGVSSTRGSLANPNSQSAFGGPEPSEMGEDHASLVAATSLSTFAPPTFSPPVASYSGVAERSPYGGMLGSDEDDTEDIDNPGESDGGVDFGYGGALDDGYDGDEPPVDFEDLSTHERLYYAGCGAEIRKQAFLRRERDLKVMNELASMSTPQITAKGRAAPSRSDEFRSTGVQVIYEKRRAHTRAMNALKQRRSEEAVPTYRVSENSQRILEQNEPYKKYASPVADWHVHHDRHIQKQVPRPLDHSFSPNINRRSHPSRKGDGGEQAPVHQRLHHDSLKNPKYNPALARELSEREATQVRRAASPNQPLRRPSEQTQSRTTGGIVFSRSPLQSEHASVSPVSPARGGHSGTRAWPDERFASPSVSSSLNDTVVSRLLSAGQEKQRRRTVATARADSDSKTKHTFKPSLNQRSLELAESRKQRQHLGQQECMVPGYMSTPERPKAQPQQKRAHSGAPARGFSGRERGDSKWVAERFLARADQRADRRRERERAMQAEREEKEMEGCTFQPKLCANSEYILYEKTASTTPVFESSPPPPQPWGVPAFVRFSSPSREDAMPQTMSPKIDSPYRVPRSAASPGRSVSPAAVPPPVSLGGDPPPASAMAMAALHTPAGAAARNNGRELSPFERHAPSKDVSLSTHSIEREIDAVLNEWNKIQAL